MDPASDHIRVSGRRVRRLPSHEYWAYHKPVGVVTTLSDPQGRPCIGDLVREQGRRLFPVGRLDFHSSGLLLLTNDGELCAKLTHPRTKVEKRYLVKVSGVPTEETIARLRAGVEIGDGVTSPCSARLVRTAGKKAWLEITLTEGRNRQVRRMLESVGLRVEKLRRTAVGPIELGNLPVGAVRRLSAGEVRALEAAVAQAPVACAVTTGSASARARR